VVTDFPEQLIEQAEEMLRAPRRQADLRRAVFHLLIRAAIANWNNAADHARLARAFDHKLMKEASARIIRKVSGLASTGAGNNVALLSFLARTFIELPETRQKADYDLSDSFTELDPAVLVAQARRLFLLLDQIKVDPLTQEYVYTLLFKDRG